MIHNYNYDHNILISIFLANKMSNLQNFENEQNSSLEIDNLLVSNFLHYSF